LKVRTGSLLLVLFSITATLAAAPAKEVIISAELHVSIEDDEEVFLAARPLPGEALDAFVRRFTDDPATKKEILAGNAGMNLLRKDMFVRVPYRLLSDNYRRIAMEALFPGDHGDARFWTHVVTAPAGHPESLWRIAEWFTGDGAVDPRRGEDRLAPDGGRPGRADPLAPASARFSRRGG